MWEIKGKDNQTKATVYALEYNGEWMGESYVTVTIESPTPIAFAIGDYLMYRSERFEINYDPGKIKSAPQFAKGDAFKYENVKFNSLADELTRCDFLDVVLGDNQLHFTGLPKFSFYGGVQDLANRIQANLNRAYPNQWTVVVSSEYSGTKELNVSVDTQKVWDALSILVNDFETYFTIKGRTITIGAAGVPAGHLFKYGKGNGLYEIEQNAEADQAIVTRLRAYGSTRNLPHRYYNSLTGADGQKLIPDNMAVENLMLPSFPYTIQDPYIDSANKAALGIREGTIFFDGSQEGLEEIYPSIEGMTAEDLHKAGVPCNSTGALDVIVSAERMTDDGVGDINEGETETTATPPTFKVTLPDLGFDINDYRTTEAATLSFKTGMLGGRDFEIVGCEAIKDSTDKVTGYELELNRVYDDGIKLWFPYKDYNAKAGDKVVILHIAMPEVYIKAAAQRLLEAATAWLAKNDYSRSVYAPKVDEIFMARQHDEAVASGGTIASLHDTLKEGMLLLFEDEDLNIDASIFIDRLSIKEGDGPVPTYEVVLKEEKTVGRLDKMQNQIDSLASGKGQGSGGYNASQIRSLIDAYGSTRFLSKLKDDTAKGKIASDIGFEIGKYLAGVSGGMFGIDKETGDSFAEVAKLFVRGKAYFETLTLIEANTLAGKQYITSGGSIKCAKVEEVKNEAGAVTAYRCYFLSEQDGEKTETKIVAGDQVISEIFNAKTGTANKVSNHRYWRLVTAVNNDAHTDESGNHYGYIDLSKTDCEIGSDIPKEGDIIDQFGNRTDATRQSAMVFSTVDSDSPSIKMYAGIGSGNTNAEHYSLTDKAIISFGREATTGKVYFRLGATSATQYLDYRQGDGLRLAGKLAVNSTIDGKTLENYFKSLIPELAQEDIEGFVNNIVGPQLEGIQDQIDGVIETWFYNGVPTLNNYPASEWNTNDLKIQHLGDLYYDNDTGTAYRFSQNAQGGYYWNTITDDAITKALAAAKAAQDTADNKRRIFTQQPAPPYDKGDLWVNATYPSDTTAVTRDPSKNKYYNDILRCGTSRATGAFAIGDWGLSSNYTDDTLAQAAKDAADKAQADADKAEADAKAAKDRLDAWAADGVISPTEKQGIKDEISRIDADKAHITAEYTRYNLGTPTTYNNAHTAYRQQLVALSAVTPENITIPSTFASNQTAYYNARTTALSAIAAAAKKYAEDIAKQEAEKAVAGFEYLKKALGDVTTIAGGVMLSSQIRLGEHNADFTTQTTWAGHNGVYGNGRTIGSWWGGDMLDLFKDNDVRKTSAELGANARPATALIRMDGSSYFANGLVGFRKNGSGWLAGDNIRWDEHGAITFGNGINIDLGSGGNTTLGGLNTSIASVTNLANKLSNLFTPYLGNTPKTWAEVSIPGTHFDSVKVNVSLWTDEFLSCLGKSDTGGSGGGSGGLVESIYRWADLGGTFDDAENDAFNAYTVSRIYSELTAADSAISARLANFYTKSEADGRYALSSALANYVTLNTEQTITARKNFSNALRFINTAPASVNQGRAIGISWHTTSDTAYADTTLHIGSMTATDADGNISSRYLYLGWGTSSWAHANNLTIGKDIFKYKGNDILHSNNYAAILDGRYVKKAGDTMTGTLTVPGLKIVSGYDAKIIIDNTDDETYWNFISFRDKGVEYGRLGTQGGTNISWNGNLIFHGGNYASYLDQRYLLNSAYTAADVLAKIKTVDGAASGLDADLLDGYHASLTTAASTVPVRDSDGLLRLPAVRNSRELCTRLNDAGWYRVFTSDMSDAQGDNILLSVSRKWNLTNNEAYHFSISVRTYMSGYKPCITQLSGTFNTHLITKIRVVQKFNSIFYIDFYYEGGNNEVVVSGFGKGVFCAPVAATIPDGYTAMEFDTVQGFKCNEELVANASSATKLADDSAFTAWGQTFFQNGKPKSVSGNMTGVGTITASGEIKSTAPSGFRIAYANYGLILRNDGNNSYFLLTDSGDANGNFNSLRPFLINNSTGRVSMNNGMSASTATISGLLAAHGGVQIGADADTGWYRYSSRITAGNATAKGVNVGSLLVSDRWADGDKVPANGIYVKGPLRIGDITIEEDKVNGGLHVSGGGLYADTFISALGVNPNDGSGTGGGGGMSYDRLDAWADYSADKAGYVLSALLGNDLYQNKLGKTEAQSLYQPKGSYVTTDTDQAISGTKTFNADVLIRNNKELSFPTASQRHISRMCSIHGGGDGASATDANLRFGSWYGIGWYPTVQNQTVPQGENAMWLNVRNGHLYVRGGYHINGGTSSQFLKADGSVDSTNYLSSANYTASDVLNKLKTVDGAGSGLDSDLLDGVHLSGLFRKDSINGDADGVAVSGVYMTYPGISNTPNNTNGNQLLHFNWDANAANQLYLRHNSDRVYARRKIGGVWQVWKTFAFLDDNVASATKLQTARTLWGRSFDGTANVSGDMTGVGSITATGSISLSASSVLQFKEAGYGDKFGIWGDFNGFDDENRMYIGSATGASGTDPALSAKLTMLLASGYIGLGTGSPTHRLHVNGYVRSNGLTLDGSHLLEWDAANTAWKFNGNLYATGGISALGITKLSATEATVKSLRTKSIILSTAADGNVSAGMLYAGTVMWMLNRSGMILIGDNAQSGSRICMSNRTVFGGSSSGSYYIDPSGDAVLKTLGVRGTIKTAASMEIRGAVFTVEGTEIYVTFGETKYKLVKTAVTA